MDRHPHTRPCLLVALLLGASAAGAAEIYHWVDEDGVAHFSQLPPPATVSADVESREIPVSTPADYDPHEDEYSVLNQAERIHAEWSALEQERLARREPRPRTPEPDVAERRYADDYDGWRYGRDYLYPVVLPNRPPLRPGHRVRRHQYRQLDDAGLWDESPAYSINSGGHRQRVEASRELPLPPRRPAERQEGP